jgi:hypothetical protein
MLTHIDGLFYDSDALIDEIIGGGHGWICVVNRDYSPLRIEVTYSKLRQKYIPEDCTMLL